MKSFLRALKSFNGFIASASTLIPGLAFFFKYSPPLIGGLAVLSIPLSAAFIWFGFKSKRRVVNSSGSTTYILAGFALSIVYWVCLDYTSIHISTAEHDIRYQIGFNLAEWSLEPDAVDNIKSGRCPDDSKENLLLCYSASSENVYLIWRRWTVYTFGVINVLVFMAASLSWSYGWGRLIKNVK